MFMVWQMYLFCIILLFFGAVNSLKSLQIHVPTAVMTGQDADLYCDYDLEGAQLYSIRWYKNMIEFYRYVPKESPATKVFPVAEIKVDVSLSDQNRVVLNQVDRSLTGEYQCEVSADAPLFHTGIKAAEMVVVEPPLLNPNVTANRMTYVGGEHIRANCTSPPSLPAANITWYVNEQMTSTRSADVTNVLIDVTNLSVASTSRGVTTVIDSQDVTTKSADVRNIHKDATKLSVASTSRPATTVPDSQDVVPGFTANHVLNFSNGFASSLATLELEAASLSPVPSLMIRCEASIFDVWKATSNTIVLRERSANPASALGRSFTGAATETRRSTIFIIILQIFLQMLINCYSESFIR